MTKSTSRLHEVNLFEKAASLLRRRDSNSAHLLASYPRQTSTPGDLKTELTPFHEPPLSGLEILICPKEAAPVHATWRATSQASWPGTFKPLKNLQALFSQDKLKDKPALCGFRPPALMGPES